MIGMKVLFYSVGAERSEAQHREPLFFLSARTFGSFAPSVFTQTLRVMKLNPTTAFNIKHNLSVCGWEDQIKNVFSKKKINSSAAHMPIDEKGLLFSQALSGQIVQIRQLFRMQRQFGNAGSLQSEA